MIPQKRFITTFQGITALFAPKQTVTVQVSAAYNYLDLYLQTVNMTIAMFQQIRLKIGGEVIQRWSGVDLDSRLQYDKQPTFASQGILKLPLRRMGIRGGMNVIDFKNSMFLSGSARDLSYESSLNCGSAGGGFKAIQDISIEIDIVNTGALAPSVQVFSRVTAPVPGGPGAVYRVDQQTKTISNGTVTITKAEMGMDALRPFINRITLVPPAGTLDNFQLRYGTNDWWTVGAKLLQYTQTEDFLRASNIPTQYVLDFQEEGWGDTMLDMSASNSDILLQFDSVGGAGTLTYYIESLGLPFASNSGN
jgi:hypothetical protein